MSNNQNAAQADKPKKESKTPKMKMPKVPKKSLDFSPVASAMFEIQRREVTSDVVSGLAFIVLGIIIVIVSIAKYVSNMKTVQNEVEKIQAVAVGADKIPAYAWIVIAFTGIIIGVIGVYEILKSFISMEQINEWAKSAESHVSPLQAIHGKRPVAQMNQAQSTEPAPQEGMAEDGSHAKKHFAFLGKKEEAKPDSSKIYNKFNPAQNRPPQNNPPQKQVVAPPRAKPMMEQKFDYGIHEAKKQTFADKFLAENKADPFEQYRKDLGMEPEVKEEYVQKPQFKRSANAEQKDANNAPKQKFSGGGLFEQLSAAQGIDSDSDDDGFFMGTNYSSDQQSAVNMQQQLDQFQKQLNQVQQVQEQLSQVQHVQEQLNQVQQVQEQLSQVQQVQEQLSQVQQVQEQLSQVQNVQEQLSQVQQVKEQLDEVQQQVEQVQKAQKAQGFFGSDKVKSKFGFVSKSAPKPQDDDDDATVMLGFDDTPDQDDNDATVMLGFGDTPDRDDNDATVMLGFDDTPDRDDNDATMMLGFDDTPDQDDNDATVMLGFDDTSDQDNGDKPEEMYVYEEVVEEAPKAPRNEGLPPIPNQPMSPVPGAPLPGQPPMGMYNRGNAYPQQMRPGYQQVPMQNMYQPLPNLRGMMPNQGGYPNSPFGFAGSYAAPNNTPFNQAVPPYQAGPFRPVNPVVPPVIPSAEQSYNSAMPPYTVHPFRPSQPLAAPQAPSGESSYNSAMPPYTVHPFTPSQTIASPQSSNGESSYNSAMPPYTVHPFKPASAEIAAPQMADGNQKNETAESSYNAAMPPYTVHPFKPANAEIAAPQIAEGADSPFIARPVGKTVTPPPLPTQSSDSYNSAMPPYTVHPFKAKNPENQPLQPQLYDPLKDGSAPSEAIKKPKAPAPEVKPAAAQPTAEKKAPPKEQPIENKNAAPKAAPKPEKQERKPTDIDAPQTKRGQLGQNLLKGVMTQRSGEKADKKSPLTQRLGEYKFSLFEEIGGGIADKIPRGSSQKSKKNEDKENPNNKNNGGKEMPFNFNGAGREPEKKKSFSEMFLNRNGKKAAEKVGERGSSEIVQNGTPAQRKFVDASEYDAWTCPGCGSVNQEYVGVCSCGERKPRTKW